MSAEPKRVQLSRRKGWKKPENTVVVSRPTRWGNPFRPFCLRKKSRFLAEKWTVATMVGFDGRGWWGCKHVTPPDMDRDAAMAHSVECYELWLQGDESRTDLVLPDGFIDKIRSELRGKNLACWCPIGASCHADVLLRLANEDMRK